MRPEWEKVQDAMKRTAIMHQMSTADIEKFRFRNQPRLVSHRSAYIGWADYVINQECDEWTSDLLLLSYKDMQIIMC